MHLLLRKYLSLTESEFIILRVSLNIHRVETHYSCTDANHSLIYM